MARWAIERVTPDDPRVADVLASAFAEVPLTRWVLRDPQDPVGVRRYLGMLVSMAGPAGIVDCEREGRGAAVWVRPDRWRAGLARRLRHAGILLGLTGVRRAPSRFVQLSRIAADHPIEPHHYLELVGVGPAQRGGGLGEALVRVGLARCDAEGRAACLHTSNPKAIPLYARCGFAVSHQLQLGGAGPRVWAMRREPA
jgi:GNAT superfamily N-acetyltransferase